MSQCRPKLSRVNLIEKKVLAYLSFIFYIAHNLLAHLFTSSLQSLNMFLHIAPNSQTNLPHIILHGVQTFLSAKRFSLSPYFPPSRVTYLYYRTNTLFKCKPLFSSPISSSISSQAVQYFGIFTTLLFGHLEIMCPKSQHLKHLLVFVGL